MEDKTVSKDLEKDYNTQREKLIMPEYGRNVQKMIEYVKGIPDKQKRDEQIRTVVQVMSILNPQLKDVNDYRHKLWDHVQVIAGFDLDIDAPYPIPDEDKYNIKPEPIPMRSSPIKEACYGRNIQNMIDVIASKKEDDDLKKELIRTLGIYMRQQYLIWNKDSVSEETIFADMERLSGGRLKVPSDIHLGEIRGDASQYMRPGIGNMGQGNPNGNRKNYKKNKKWKKN
ncbi:MAG: DUF4290 domain-containing protein [Bacteroidales bacterium]|jgi:hypothetical protein|nr:DUF4290 domain-containing protein [Bacteroidales bacterium]MCI2121470.1 DUF4290 domain-containing protein [Bacteroidales bacterium]MCI2145267.1 DUF4290 domain-containing protein [Bacteroidales bacterium]